MKKIIEIDCCLGFVKKCREVFYIKKYTREKVIIVICLSFFISSCNLLEFDFFDEVGELTSDSSRIDNDELLLNGKVKSYRLVIEKLVGRSGNVLEDEYPIIHESVFNEVGDKIVQIKYDSEGDLISKTAYEYKYDTNENIIEKISYDTIGTIINNIIYRFDEQNNLIEQISNGGLSMNYIYDDEANKIEEISSHSNGAWWKKSYKYDQMGNVIEERGSDYWSPQSDGKTIYQYDGQNNLIKRTIYSTDGGLSHIEIYEYNGIGKLIEKRDEFSRYGSNTRDKHIYKYDVKGNEIERFRYSLGGRIQYKNAYQIEYDSKDNWIKKVEIVNDVIEFIALREIVYFEGV